LEHKHPAVDGNDGASTDVDPAVESANVQTEDADDDDDDDDDDDLGPEPEDEDPFPVTHEIVLKDHTKVSFPPANCCRAWRSIDPDA
jgi:hypothetical protein